jgi:hypothetical protein
MTIEGTLQNDNPISTAKDRWSRAENLSQNSLHVVPDDGSGRHFTADSQA